jgi:hypothetical protein
MKNKTHAPSGRIKKGLAMKHINYLTIPSESTPAPASLLETTQKGIIAGSFATALGGVATAFNTLTTVANAWHKIPPASS